MKDIIERAQQQAEREEQLAEMQREQAREVADLQLRHAIERLVSRRVKGYWCRQAFEYLSVRHELDVYVVEGMRFAQFALDGEKPYLRVWRWSGTEKRMWWSGPLNTLTDLARLEFKEPAQEEAA